MANNNYKNLSRKELEQEMENLSLASEKQEIKLEAKDRTIEHLMANARKWSHRFKHEVSKNAVELAKTSIAEAKLENSKLNKRLVRTENANVSLFKKIGDLRAELMEEQAALEIFKKRGEEAPVPAMKFENEETSMLELPVEMQREMSKYVA